MNHIRLKHIANIEMGQSPPSSEYTTEDEGIPFLQGTAEFGEKYPSPVIYSLSPNKFSYENDILFSVRAPVGEININNQKIGIGRGLCSIRAKNNNSQQFLWWALHAVRVQLKYLETGTTYSAVSTEDISNLVLPVHDLNVQNKIVNYLDKEVAKIDDLIEKKIQLINVLEEKKKAVINQAVTKGLDLNVPMKDSGIEWLGNIPKHWKLVKLKYIVSKIDELNEFDVELKIAVENIEGFSGKLINLENFNYEGNTSKFKINDIIFNKLRPYLGKVHLADQEGGVYGELLVLRPKEKLVPKFLFYTMISTKFINLVNSSTTGAKMPRASWDDFIKNIFLPVIPIREQQAIAEYLDKTLIENSRLSNKLKDSIDLLKEKRTAIISAAVNGELNDSLS